MVDSSTRSVVDRTIVAACTVVVSIVGIVPTSVSVATYVAVVTVLRVAASIVPASIATSIVSSTLACIGMGTSEGIVARA